MYLRCRNCDWSQDDFYDKDYNPAKSLLDWNGSLFGDDRKQLDEQFSNDSEFIKENGKITTREVVAREYESFASKIRAMKWVTYEDYEKDKNSGVAKCPKCGSFDDLNID